MVGRAEMRWVSESWSGRECRIRSASSGGRDSKGDFVVVLVG